MNSTINILTELVDEGIVSELVCVELPKSAFLSQEEFEER